MPGKFSSTIKTVKEELTENIRTFIGIFCECGERHSHITNWQIPKFISKSPRRPTRICHSHNRLDIDTVSILLEPREECVRTRATPQYHNSSLFCIFHNLCI